MQIPIIWIWVMMLPCGKHLIWLHSNSKMISNFQAIEKHYSNDKFWRKIFQTNQIGSLVTLEPILLTQFNHVFHQTQFRQRFAIKWGIHDVFFLRSFIIIIERTSTWISSPFSSTNSNCCWWHWFEANSAMPCVPQAWYSSQKASRCWDYSTPSFSPRLRIDVLCWNRRVCYTFIYLLHVDI